MRHRIGGEGTGLGNPKPARIDSRPTGILEIDVLARECLKEANNQFFKNYDEDWPEVSVMADEIRIGIEPAYMYEDLKILCIHREKEYSYYETGYAWGAYGSDIASTRRHYKDYKRRSKFIKFIDKWYTKFFNCGGNASSKGKQICSK